ncbi:MAG: hypothetical protein HPY75_02385 [Actinobacteria bacterium]|nr:hypothetical protein [Actinomycetota bacterium]
MTTGKSCRKAARLIGPFVDGELPASRAEELERHLSACSACALRHRRMRSMVGELSSLPTISPSPGEREELLMRVRRELSESAPAPAFHRRAQIAAAAVSLLAIAVVVVTVTMWGGKRAPVVEESASGEFAPTEVNETTGPKVSPESSKYYAGEGVLNAALSSTPSLVAPGREYGEGELAGYRDDLGARLDFYSAYWYPYSMGALDEADMRRAQRELTDQLAATAASIGGDPTSLRTAIEAALSQAGDELLLPCHAELAKVDGRECWLISLSGPEDYLLFSDPQRPPAMVLASLGGEESLKVSESLLRELAAGLAPYEGASPQAPSDPRWEGSGTGLEREETGQATGEEETSGTPTDGGEPVGETQADFRSFLRDLSARYNSLDMLDKLERLNYEQVIMLLHGNWAGLAAEGVNLGDFLRPPRRLWAVDRETGAVVR